MADRYYRQYECLSYVARIRGAAWLDRARRDADQAQRRGRPCGPDPAAALDAGERRAALCRGLRDEARDEARRLRSAQTERASALRRRLTELYDGHERSVRRANRAWIAEDAAALGLWTACELRLQVADARRRAAERSRPAAERSTDGPRRRRRSSSSSSSSSLLSLSTSSWATWDSHFANGPPSHNDRCASVRRRVPHDGRQQAERAQNGPCARGDDPVGRAPVTTSFERLQCVVSLDEPFAGQRQAVTRSNRQQRPSSSPCPVERPASDVADDTSVAQQQQQDDRSRLKLTSLAQLASLSLSLSLSSSSSSSCAGPKEEDLGTGSACVAQNRQNGPHEPPPHGPFSDVGDATLRGDDGPCRLRLTSWSQLTRSGETVASGFSTPRSPDVTSLGPYERNEGCAACIPPPSDCSRFDHPH